MSLQNRVNPEGEICRCVARGELMGNRGCLHNEAKEIVTQSTRDAWVSCLLKFEGRRRTIMEPGKYTELFFLDEATALAAGHRPCATCRRDRYIAFIAAWSVGNRNGDKVLASAVDKQMKQDRASKARMERTSIIGFPTGTMFKQIETSIYYLINDNNVYQWSFEGYYSPKTISSISGPFIILTPACTIKALQSGYVAQLHPSAHQ